MKCPICKDEEGIYHSIYGLLPGIKCQDRHKNYPKPDHQVEMTSDSIKQQRKEYQKSIIQPRRDGVLSKEYLSVYGTKGIKVTDEEVSKSENVWGDIIDADNLKRTK